ncbi:MAG: SpoIIE family protein phosphatase, partial [Bacteroidota bacterium]
GVIQIKKFKHEKGIFEYRKNKNAFFSFTQLKYDSAQGVPEGDISIENINKQIIFATNKGLYKIESGHFIPNHSFQKQFSDGSHIIHRVACDNTSGNIWLETIDIKKNKFNIGFLKKENNGNYLWCDTLFFPYSDEIIHSIFHDANGISWFGGTAGLFRFDINTRKNINIPYNTLIRKVTVGNDSAIFYGAFSDTNHSASFVQSSTMKPILPFINNSIIFEFAAPDFSNEIATQYQYFMEGFDKNWSNWQQETKAVYTNLPKGNYFFRVKAKNIFQKESKEAVFEFTIRPPWYFTWWAYICYIILSIGFIWGIVIFFTRGLKAIIRERTLEIVKQKNEIEYKNREITDSINYAKRIQESILHHQKLLYSQFSESFILYKPRDIVSGDFYWFVEKNRKFIVAACDCTGHGVPGAFMSLIGYSLLNEVVIEKSIEEPSKILDSIKQGIIKLLGQTGQEGEQKDGMDMSLVSLELKSDTDTKDKSSTFNLRYAGANNPLYIIRKGQLIELNADRMPIGIYFGQDRPFTTKELLIESGDIFYLFTDGFTDQFGGDKGKKFTKKRFKDFLITIQHEPMSRQKELLDKLFADWSNKQQQVDDVMVIGIRV